MQVSVVIPALNEEAALPGLLKALLGQTCCPDEIIVVDAESTDQTSEIVAQWAQSGAPVRCIPGLRGGCGIGRNIGIKAAAHDWIVLLDCGMEPIPSWLDSLEAVQQSTKAPAVFAKCRYMPVNRLQKALCSIAWGERPVAVVPCALIHRSVFETIGFFREDLQAVEDQEWTGRFLQHYSTRCIMDEAVTPHLDVPDNLKAIYCKWVHYYECAVAAGVLGWVQVLYLGGTVFLFFAFLFFREIAFTLVLLYLGARSIALPLRRGTPWSWLIMPANFATVLTLALCIDVAKVLGFTIGRFGALKATLRTFAPIEGIVLPGFFNQDLRPIHLFKTTFINVFGRSGAVIFPLLIAYLYGATETTDALFWITGILFWLGGGISVAAELVSVPLVTREQKEERFGTSNVLRALSLKCVQWGIPITVALLVIGVGSVMFTPLLSPQVKPLALSYLIEVLPMVVLMLLTAVWTAALAANGAFTASGWSMGLRWCFILAAVPLLAIPSIAPFWASVFLLGELARLGVLYFWARFAGIWQTHSSKFSIYMVGDLKIAPFAIQAIAMFAINATPIIGKAMAATLGTGNISLFEYAWTVYLVLPGIVSSGLLVVLYSDWSKVFSFRGPVSLGLAVQQAYYRSMKWTTVPTLFILAILVWYWNDPFPIGSLSPQDGRNFVGVFGALSLGIPGVLAGLMAMRGLLVIQSHSTILYIALGKCALNITLNWILIGPFGLAGIGLAIGVTEIISAICLYVAFMGSLRKLNHHVAYE